MNKSDIELLLETLKVPTMTGKEWIMGEFLANKLSELGIPFKVDERGNIYRLLKGMPLMSAHMDSVGDASDQALLPYIRISNNIIRGLGNIGADDKVGVFIILRMLIDKTLRDKISFVFSVSEESGLHGIDDFVKVEKDKLSKLPYYLVLDRQHATDLICVHNQYGTKEFENAVLEIIGQQFGYKSEHGLRSDANELSEYMSGANMSVGYHSPHTDNEYVNTDHTENAYNAAVAIVRTLTGKFKKPDKVAYTAYAPYQRAYDWSDGYDSNNKYGTCKRCKTYSMDLKDGHCKACKPANATSVIETQGDCIECGKKSYLWGDGLCQECAFKTTGILESGKEQCAICGKNFVKSDLTTVSDEDKLCNTCRDEMTVQCPHCKKYTYTDDVEYTEDDNKNAYCPHCNKPIGKIDDLIAQKTVSPSAWDSEM